MPDGSLGSEVPLETRENFELHKEFSKELLGLWIVHQRETTMDPTRFQRVTAQAMVYTAAALAVGIHQSEEMFVAIARACHQAALKAAPKWNPEQ